MEKRTSFGIAFMTWPRKLSPPPIPKPSICLVWPILLPPRSLLMSTVSPRWGSSMTLTIILLPRLTRIVSGPTRPFPTGKLGEWSSINCPSRCRSRWCRSSSKTKRNSGKSMPPNIKLGYKREWIGVTNCTKTIFIISIMTNIIQKAKKKEKEKKTKTKWHPFLNTFMLTMDPRFKSRASTRRPNHTKNMSMTTESWRWNTITTTMKKTDLNMGKALILALPSTRWFGNNLPPRTIHPSST
mmetsp:Transcript_7814/g.16209  ORF Transcript_7814/g.16209 Transcript_7814/m.16209 type:complete len:241 (+) Transcript_7814:441-1163(+)